MTEKVRILVVEDDAAMRESCVKVFRAEGYRVAEAASAAQALDRIKAPEPIDIVLTDLKMSGMDGLTLLREIKLLDPTIDVVLMTGYGTIKNAIAAMKHGAADYITKPFDTNELMMTVDKIVQLRGLRVEVSRLRTELRDRYHFDNLVGHTADMQRVYEKIHAASQIDSTVLICGESGTGKELVAKAIHYNGPRAPHPFVPINCAAMPGELIESELFGHVRGAFTGAVRDSDGLFRSAGGGTIFLDEIVDMPYSTQAKLLRTLQERSVRPIGGTEEIPIDVRVIASTNQNVEEAIGKAMFREDLYYRLGVVRIDLPPLRDRLEDVPALVSHFIAEFNSACHRKVDDIDEDALVVLTRYPWPGNVRELASAVENAFAFGESSTIRRCDLPRQILEQGEAQGLQPPGRDSTVPSLLEAERELVIRALRVTAGNKARAAEMLGISRPRLYNMIRRHEIEA